MTRKRDDALIALVLGDAGASPDLERWLETTGGRRERAAYASTLGALDHLYRDAPGSVAPGVVYFDAMDSPVGPLLLACTDRGLLRLAFTDSEAALKADLARRRIVRPLLRSAEKLALASAQLEEYFAGRRRAFELRADLDSATLFQRRVLEAARKIPAGGVSTYGEIARSIGQPRASRAVGQALGHNPVPIVIPCHRVLGGGGGMGGYTGGLEIKRKLLQIEGFSFPGQLS